MRFLNRTTELGLNILQLMYCTPKDGAWTSGLLAERLKDSELFVHQVLRVLRQTGYLYSMRGPTGGFKLHPEVPNMDMKGFLQHFNKDFTPNSILSTDSASEVVNQAITGFLVSMKLKDLFEGRKPIKPKFRFKINEGNDCPPKGAA